MRWKARLTHDKNGKFTRNTSLREGKEVYRHPEGRFVVLEFQGINGKFRESFWPEELIGIIDRKAM